MLKNPILQISYKNLREKLLLTSRSCDISNFNQFYDMFVQNVQKVSERNYIIASNKSKYDTRKLTTNVKVFNVILEQERLKLNHRYIKTIFRGDRQYKMLMDLANYAEEFCSVFNLSINKGFKIYISTGLKIIGKNYSLNKFKTYNEKIFDIYEKYWVVDNDEHEELTIKIFEYYLSKFDLNEKMTLTLWDNYGHDFVYCGDDILVNEIDYKHWIDGQFEGMKFLKAIPEPYQLHGINALKRVGNKRIIKQNSWRDKAMKMKRKS